MNFKWLYLILLSSVLVLSGCGGSSENSTELSEKETPTDGGGGGTGGPDDGSGGGEDTIETGVTFYSLSILEAFKTFSGFENDERFTVFFTEPTVMSYMINPVDSETLEPVSDASIEDYSLTENGISLDPNENFQMLQKVIGTKITLHTAIVVDTSGGMDVVDIDKLEASIKSYITAAKNSSNESVKNQLFTIWGFAEEVKDYTFDQVAESAELSFTSDTAQLNAAIEQLTQDWKDKTLGRFSNLYGAIGEANGRYLGTGAAHLGLPDGAFNFRDDPTANRANDLVAAIHPNNGITLTNIVLISSGNDNVGEFDAELLTETITSQSLIVYNAQAEIVDTDDENTGDGEDSGSDALSDATELLGKALIYINFDENADANVVENSEKVIDIDASSNSYGFSDDLLEAQELSISARIDTDNLYMIRYATGKRIGKHEIVLSSQTQGFSYSLTSEIDLGETSQGIIGPDPRPEITGLDNAYLASNRISLAVSQEIFPVTRWSNVQYTADDYEWSVGGVTRNKNASGSITLQASDIGKDVVLTNTKLLANSIALTVEP